MSLRVAVVGSFRENDKCFHYKRTLDEFRQVCFLIGQELAKSNQVAELIVSIPNDLNERQTGVIKSVTGFDRVYKFEHTADYLTMLGFLSYSSVPQAKKVKLYISDLMINGGVSTEHGIKILPFWENTFSDMHTGVNHSLKSYKSFISVESIDPNKLRTMIVQQYVANELDLLITIGGGKATDAVYNTVKEKKAVLSIPHFLGTSLKYFASAVKNKTRVLGYLYSSIFSSIPRAETISFICSTPVEDIDSLTIPIKELDLLINDLSKEIKNGLNIILSKEVKKGTIATPVSADAAGSSNSLEKPWYKSDAFKIQIAAVILTFLLSLLLLLKCNSTATKDQSTTKDSSPPITSVIKNATSSLPDTRQAIKKTNDGGNTTKNTASDTEGVKTEIPQRIGNAYFNENKKSELLSVIDEACIKLKVRKSSFIIMSVTKSTNAAVLFSEIKKFLFENNVRTVDLNSFQIEDANDIILRKLNGHLNIVVGTIENENLKFIIKDFR